MARRTGSKARSISAKVIITDKAHAESFTTAKAAKYLGYKSDGSIRKLVSLKKLHPIKIGRDSRFWKADLDNYNENLRLPRGRPIRPTRSKQTQAERERIRKRVRKHRAKTGKKATRKKKAATSIKKQSSKKIKRRLGKSFP